MPCQGFCRTSYLFRHTFCQMSILKFVKHFCKPSKLYNFCRKLVKTLHFSVRQRLNLSDKSEIIISFHFIYHDSALRYTNFWSLFFTYEVSCIFWGWQGSGKIGWSLKPNHYIQNYPNVFSAYLNARWHNPFWRNFR